MALDLFAGIPVTGYAALPWYERFFGVRPSFLPNDTEAVWEVAEHRYVYIVQEPGRAGTPWCCRSPDLLLWTPLRCRAVTRRLAASGYGVRRSSRACPAGVRCGREHGVCGGSGLADQ
jgi:hypothetical protein